MKGCSLVNTGGMKVRYAVKCPWCGVMLTPGALGARFRGLIWHSACIRAYEKSREPLVASG